MFNSLLVWIFFVLDLEFVDLELPFCYVLEFGKWLKWKEKIFEACLASEIWDTIHFYYFFIENAMK